MQHAWDLRRRCKSFLMRKPEGNKSLGKPRRRWEEETRMNLRVIGWECEVD
jgi:hypothetical protein